MPNIHSNWSKPIFSRKTRGKSKSPCRSSAGPHLLSIVITSGKPPPPLLLGWSLFSLYSPFIIPSTPLSLSLVCFICVRSSGSFYHLSIPFTSTLTGTREKERERRKETNFVNQTSLGKLTPSASFTPCAQTPSSSSSSSPSSSSSLLFLKLL